MAPIKKKAKTEEGKAGKVKGSLKRKADEAAAEAEAGAPAAKTGKKEKVLSKKQAKRKEVTTLYGDLINPGREVQADTLVGDILDLLQKRPAPLHQYCCSEVGSRVVQACLKWGSKEQKSKVLDALKDHLAKMSIDRYGCMVVMKLLRYCTRTASERKPTPDEKKLRAKNSRSILEAFRGKGLRTAFFHKYGCRVVNSIYFSDFASVKEKRTMLHEVAVPQALALTRSEFDGRPLRQLLAAKDLKNDDRAAMVSHLAEQVERCVEKELLACDVVHLLFQAYCEVASETQLRDLAGRCMAGAPNLLSSKPGAEAALYILGVATAKEKKAFCKELKGKFVALATNAVDYTVMMRLASIVDDTVMLEKTMLAEWMSDLETLCFDKYGAKVLSWLLRPDDPRIFSPYERQCLAVPAPSAIKAADKRRQEILRTIRPALLTVLQENALKVCSDVHAKDLLLAYMSSDWNAGIVEAVLSAVEAAVSKAAGKPKKEELELIDNGTTTTTLIALLRIEPAASDAPLAAPLWRRCFQGRLAELAATRCTFVVRALLKNGGATADAVRSGVSKSRAAIEAAAKAAEASAAGTSGVRSLLAAIDGKEAA
eukprot:TRINITY_DN4390_c3_g3_i1.p1 TRINITY_DN4390_c3_g3~~TRINITY_DN4390_c3_g3_i1.p1  ORF type:complete len:618 (+),score=183.19 TRINITY_DN4390_c3_g3_i1:63-1856(+)